MNAVFVSWAFAPMAFPRSIQVGRLAGHLTRLAPEVICASEVGDEDPTIADVLRGREFPVRRVAAPRIEPLVKRLTYRGRLLLPDPQRLWARAAAGELRRRGLDRGDALVTFGQPMSDHLVGLGATRPPGVPWVAHFSDPWTDNPYAHVLRRRTRGLERRVIEAADALVFTCQETLDLVMAKYPPAWRERASVVSHAYDPTLYPPARPRRDEADLVVRYIGSFYGPRGPGPLLAALDEVRRRAPGVLEGVKFEFVGTGSENLPHGAAVEARPRVSYRESLALMRSADLLLVIDAPAERNVFLPSKLIDYLGAGPPVLALTPRGPVDRLVRQAGGWVADPADAAGSARAVTDALTAVRSGRPASWAPASLLVEHAAPAIAARFEDVVLRAAA